MTPRFFLTSFLLAALQAETAQAGACVIGNTPIDVKTCGAVGNGSTDDTAAIQAALDASEANGNKPIYLSTGTYKITAPLAARQGTMILGEGSQGSTVGFGSTLLVVGNGDAIVWDGTGRQYAGTGGGVRNLLIVKESGSTGGTAVRIAATSDSQRPGEMVVENVLVYGRGTGQWDRGFVIDGRKADTDGARGVRSVMLSKARAASCLVDFECIVIDQGTHVTATHLQVDTGNGTGRPGLTIRGVATNVNLANIIVHGTVVIQDGPTNVNLHGRVTDLRIVGKTVSGTAVVSAESITNASKFFRLLSNANPSFRARSATTVSLATGNGSLVRPVFATTDYNHAGAYNASTGVFTAPAAGRYRFQVQMGLGGIGALHTRYDLSFQHTQVATGAARFTTVIGNPRRSRLRRRRARPSSPRPRSSWRRATK